MTVVIRSLNSRSERGIRIMFENKFEPFSRKAYYYETDGMGIVHHSNYIRWMEEARINWLENIGYPYTRIEESGLMIPVLSAECEYKYPVRFDEEFEIQMILTGFNGVKFSVEYRIYNKTADKLSAIGKSSHCFVNKDFRPVRTKRDFPELYDVFNDNLNIEF